MLEKSIHVTMFKSLTIEYNGISVGYQEIRSRKIIKLLGYLLFYSKRQIDFNELIDLLWINEDIKHPVAALKNLICRLRGILKTLLQIDNLIITGKGTYYINNEFSINIDALGFEKRHLQIDQEPNNYVLYEEILQIYTGNFLAEVCNDYQLLSKATYFHSIYLARVLDYAVLLEQENNYTKIEAIMKKAIELDSLDEDLYEMLIRSLYFQKKYSQAFDVYKQITDVLYLTLGTSPSKGMKDLYVMIKDKIHNDDINFLNIQTALLNEEYLGAYLCEYNAFRGLYTIQAKKLNGLGVCAYLCYLTVECHNDKDKRLVEETMQIIELSLVQSLCADDIVSRLDKNQFIILLSVNNYEDSYYVMNRVLKDIQRALNNKVVRIDLLIKAMEKGATLDDIK